MIAQNIKNLSIYQEEDQDQLHHCYTGEYGIELIAIRYVDLHATASHAGMLLKSRLKAAASEVHARQV